MADSLYQAAVMILELEGYLWDNIATQLIFG
jgi:hypothetical protein